MKSLTLQNILINNTINLQNSEHVSISKNAQDETSLQGTVVAAYGKRYQVELIDTKQRISCVTRGKKTDLACGDLVTLKLTDKHEGVVESTLPRKTLLFRSNAFKSKMLAANVTQIIIVLATQPSFYEALLNRCLIAAEAAGIKALIVLNKCDLADNHDALKKLALYTKLGYQVLPLSAKEDISSLRPYLQNEVSILVGQSGMGKSTMINALLPNEAVRTQEVSQVLDSGKHTTTAAHLYHLDENSQLIDSPGLQEFGLHHLSTDELEHAFIEFRPLLGKCRFNNCKHLQEPDCAITEALAQNKISAERLAIYKMLRTEITHSAH
ncbi:ribosome small subunit-dependent GTPase A [Methylotenera sp.]|uniref:ribosome small subunit-dependent GTPase A n=1 Tax=Methylotenera sp. TaxID=2051956 RepID=UPI0027373079|nr:ribosome small subunit-dependent GTPase A [Methylotenera sp.]MDP3210422.1 ribosome small subunit-dependent GTPase A [Methylotenera sp.]MDP3776764.1 ribosome small subunit-dependent GTPase A [Methylotenera sp.]